MVGKGSEEARDSMRGIGVKRQWNGLEMEEKDNNRVLRRTEVIVLEIGEKGQRVEECW